MSSIKKNRDDMLGSDKIDTDIVEQYTKLTCEIAMFNPRNREEGSNFMVTMLHNVFKDPINRHILPNIHAINILLDGDAEIGEFNEYLTEIKNHMEKVIKIYDEIMLKEYTIKFKNSDDFEDNKELYKEYNYEQDDLRFNGISVKGSYKYLEDKVSKLKKEVDTLRKYYNGEYEKYSINQFWYWTGGWFSRIYNWGASYANMRNIYQTFGQVHLGSISTDIESNLNKIKSAKAILDLQLQCTIAIQTPTNTTNIRIYSENLERQLATFYERLSIEN